MAESTWAAAAWKPKTSSARRHIWSWASRWSIEGGAGLKITAPGTDYCYATKASNCQYFREFLYTIFHLVVKPKVTHCSSSASIEVAWQNCTAG